jgi:hypothetical protein
MGIALKKLSVVLLLAFAFGVPVLAQSDPPPIELGPVTFSGNIRERYEAWDWFQPASGQNLYGYSDTQIRFGLSQTRENYDWNVEVRSAGIVGHT